MRNSRQITVLRSLFKTLHPILESGLAPARRLLTGTQEHPPEPGDAQPNRANHASSTTKSAATVAGNKTATGANALAIPRTQPTIQPTAAPKAPPMAKRKPAALERTLTDEHLVIELDNITRQISLHGHTAHAAPSRRATPQRGQRHYSRDTLLALLEEAKVRIQVLETELELARGFDETIPMLTEEWQDDEPEQRN